MLNGSYDVIVGNAVQDFDLRFTPGGAAVGDVTIAVNSREQVDGEWVDRDDPMYVKVTVWWEYAEHCAETITQGMRLIAVGPLYVRKWETRDGEERLSLEMTADEIGPVLRWAEAKVIRVAGRDDDRGRGRGRDDDRGDRGNRRGARGRDDDDRGRSRRGSGRGSDSGRRGSSARDDDRDDRRGGGRARDDRGGSRGRSTRQSVWDADERDDDPNAPLPDDPDF